jgi:signal transduction histidine kinase
VAVRTSGQALEDVVLEHAALRRVATLVAREPSRSEVFAAVTKETGQLLGATRATLLRVENPEWAVVVAGWTAGDAPPVPVGHRGKLDGRGLLGQMLRTARPVRIENFDDLGEGAVTALMRELGISAAAGGPIIIGGRVWGAVSAVWADATAIPPGAEHRIAAFAELVAYAIENAETRDELAASRARLVEASDEARRRIERDLHDGAQQRLVAARLELTLLGRRLADAPVNTRASLDRAREQLDSGLSELRDLARGIHPTVLTDRGLEPALAALVRRAPLHVDLRAAVPVRLDPVIEAAAYFLTSEGLTNVAKYSGATSVSVDVATTDDTLVVTIADDGVGGADPSRGSGLRGLVDRVEAVGGHLEVNSPRGDGTRLCARLPTKALGSLTASSDVNERH